MKTNRRAKRVAITLMAVLTVWATTVAAVPSTGPTVQVQAVVEAGTVRFEAQGSDRSSTPRTGRRNGCLWWT